MFTKIGKGKRRRGSSRGRVARRPRGRPRGPTERGQATRGKLYRVATRLVAARGYEATTLRDIARAAGVSPGLLYRYFPGKRAVVLALYEELSAEYAARAAAMKPGPWSARFLFGLETSLAVLEPHRATLSALVPLLVGDGEEGLFAPATAFARERVEGVFREAAAGAADAPAAAEELGRLLYVAHLAVILWWLLDRSPRQRATRELVASLGGVLAMAGSVLQLETGQVLLRTADALCRAALLGEA